MESANSYISAGYEKEVRKHTERAVNFARNIKRADDTLKSIKRCLGDRVEEHNITFEVLGLFDTNPSISVKIRALDKNMYLDSLLSEEPAHGDMAEVLLMEDEERMEWVRDRRERNEIMRERNLAKSDANMELCFSILGRIHGYFCINWRMNYNTKYYSSFTGKMFDDPNQVTIVVNFEGALSAEYTTIKKPIPENEVTKEYTEEVSVCEVGWTAPQGYDD